ncbi:MAG: HRDC domain-containing protein, partial [Gemmataceae bacterium]|nr:HRDC domain-containing protein [Gemmataceae bacterium]
EGRYQPELCLLQVATPETLYVIDPYTVGRLDPFWELLFDPQRLVVLHGGKEDLRICREQGGRLPARIFDTQIAAGLVGLDYPLGYARLVQTLFGVEMSKDLTMSNWRQRPLTTAQIRYALDDVRYLLPAYQRLQRQLHKRQRQAWAEEEFRQAMEQAVAEGEKPESWRRLKGLARLDRQGLAVAREVYLWREDYSRQINRPPRQVLSDPLLVRIARLRPRARKELISLRGLPQHLADDILDAVRRALSLPLHACPQPLGRIPETAAVVAVAQFLQIVLHDWSIRQAVASALAATVTDLKALAHHHLSGRDIPELPLFRGWRSQVLLPELQAVLEGRRLLGVDRRCSNGSPLRIVPYQPEDPVPQKCASSLPACVQAEDDLTEADNNEATAFCPSDVSPDTGNPCCPPSS